MRDQCMVRWIQVIIRCHARRQQSKPISTNARHQNRVSAVHPPKPLLLFVFHLIHLAHPSKPVAHHSRHLISRQVTPGKMDTKMELDDTPGPSTRNNVINITEPSPPSFTQKPYAYHTLNRSADPSICIDNGEILLSYPFRIAHEQARIHGGRDFQQWPNRTLTRLTRLRVTRTKSREGRSCYLEMMSKPTRRVRRISGRCLMGICWYIRIFWYVSVRFSNDVPFPQFRTELKRRLGVMSPINHRKLEADIHRKSHWIILSSHSASTPLDWSNPSSCPRNSPIPSSAELVCLLISFDSHLG